MCTGVLLMCSRPSSQPSPLPPNVSISRYHLSNISITIPTGAKGTINRLIREGKVEAEPQRSALEGGVIRTTSLLRPAWEILVVVEEEDDGKVDDAEEFYCLFPSNAMSAARPLVALLSTGEVFQVRDAGKRPTPNAVLPTYTDEVLGGGISCDCKSTLEAIAVKLTSVRGGVAENDVVAFVKGVQESSTDHSESSTVCSTTICQLP